MNDSLEPTIKAICSDSGNDPTRLLDVALAVQARYGCVSDAAMTLIAAEIGIPRVDVEAVVSFYTFLSREPYGRVVIRLSNDIIDRLHGYERVKQAFCEELGIDVGETTPDGRITLETTACIGMCDQAPAALVNDVVVTRLSSDRAREIVRELREHMDPGRLVQTMGDGNNADPLVCAMVENNIRQAGPIVFGPLNRGEAIKKALAISPNEVIRAVKTARLRGRGGAGFPTGMKWDFARTAEVEQVERIEEDEGDESLAVGRDYTREMARSTASSKKFVICNADEGEPGTFKDRVILTERPDRVFAGMTIAGYAIGASEGILYLRGEYAYLRAYLEHVLEQRRHEHLLGPSICGQPDFDFEIRIQMGAGAYVCGEETALINSCEGHRGDPKNRPPFPAQSGYLGRPTVVNNVETLCCVTRILEEGPATFSEYGPAASTGTKVLSVSGDCHRPGIYEVPFGISLRSVLELAGAGDAAAVQVGGPSGQMVGPNDFGRALFYEDLSTGGSIMVFGPQRNVLEVVHAFMEFFVDESCGYCTPCRVGNVLLKEGIERIMSGRGEPEDLVQLESLGQMVKAASRCGLGQTSPNPVLTTLTSFRSTYESLVQEEPGGLRRAFDLDAAIEESAAIAGRAPALETN